MTLYSRWTLQSIPELAPFTPTERVLLWKRATKAVALEHGIRQAVLMGIIGGFGGGVGSRMGHPVMGAALGGVVAGVVVTFLMGRPIRRRLHDEIFNLRRSTARHAAAVRGSEGGIEPAVRP
jgi:hypothetical protein